MIYAIRLNDGRIGAFRGKRTVPDGARVLPAAEARELLRLDESRCRWEGQPKLERTLDRVAKAWWLRRILPSGKYSLSLADRLREFKRIRFTHRLELMAGAGHPILAAFGDVASVAVSSHWRERSGYQQRHGYSNGSEVYLHVVATPEQFTAATFDFENRAFQIGEYVARITGRARADWKIERMSAPAAVAPVAELVTA